MGGGLERFEKLAWRKTVLYILQNNFLDTNKSNQMLLVTSAENTSEPYTLHLTPYSEMLTYEPLTNNEVKKNKKNKR